MKLVIICACALLLVLTGGRTASAQNTAPAADKLVYADFETIQDNRPVSSRGGLVQIYTGQENPGSAGKFKGLAGANPGAPELVHLKQGDPNRAAALDYQLFAPNQYANVTLDIYGLPNPNSKTATDDVSGYKYLMLQVYATGVTSVRVEFASQGQGFKLQAGWPQTSFKVMPGFNTYKIALKSLEQPAWAPEKISIKDLLKKLTNVSVSVYCNACAPTQGTLVVDNLVFQN